MDPKSPPSTNCIRHTSQHEHSPRQDAAIPKTLAKATRSVTRKRVCPLPRFKVGLSSTHRHAKKGGCSYAASSVSQLIASSIELGFKILSFQPLASSHSRAFSSAEETGFPVLLRYQLERVKPAYQRPHRVNAAVRSFQKKTSAPSPRFSHFVNVKPVTHGLRCKSLNRFHNRLRYLPGVLPQKQNSPRPVFRVSTAKSTLRTLKAHTSGITKPHPRLRHQTVPRPKTLTRQTSTVSIHLRIDSFPLKTSNIYFHGQKE